MMYPTIGRITQAVVLRMDCKRTKVEAGRPVRCFYNSPGRR